MASLSYGQTMTCGTLANPTANIAITTGVIPFLRVEGQTELAQDVTSGASGCAMTGGASAGTVSVTLNTPVTSQALTSTTTEATLIVTNTGVVPHTTQAVQGSVSPDGFTLAFAGVNFPVAFTFIVQNVRVNASVAANIDVTETVNLQYGPSNLVSGSLIVGIVQPSMSAALHVLATSPTVTFNSYTTCAGNPLPLSGSTTLLTVIGNNTATTNLSFQIDVAELWPGAFKTQNAAGSATELGSYVSGSTIGSAASGTQIQVTLGNIPASATVYLPLTVTAGAAASATTMQIVGATAAATAPVTGLNVVAFTPTNGVITATYTVTVAPLSTALTFPIPVDVTFAANAASAQGPMTVLASYGPVGAVTGPATAIPNFAAPSNSPINAGSIVACAVQISTTTLPGAVVGTSYSQTLTGSGGMTPYIWSATGLSSTGLSLNSVTGVLSGTPTGSGTFSVTVTLTDSSVPALTGTTAYKLVISPAKLTLTTTALPSGVVGTPYFQALVAGGGTTPYNWSATGLSSTGLSLNSSTGVLSGTPTASGTFSVTVTVTDSSAPPLSLANVYQIVIAAGSTAPAPNSVQNPASNTLPGLPNYGIAQGSNFIVYGSNLGPTTFTNAPSLPLQTSLNGVSITVTVGSTTVNAFMAATWNTQLSAILPSNTPTGNGTLTVTYNGASGSTPILVVTTDVGIFSANQTGTGPAAATHAGGSAISNTNAANTGEEIVLWATGLGPITGSDAIIPPSGSPSTPITVYIGGVQASVAYSGRSAAPSLDQINVIIPTGISGCYVSVVVQTGGGANLVSNTTTVAIAASGSTCSDANEISLSGLSGPLSSKGTASIGVINLVQQSFSITINGITQTSNGANVGASFEKFTSLQLQESGSLFSYPSIGSCTVTVLNGLSVVPPTAAVTATPLDAGSAITGTPPSGSAFNLTPQALTKGYYLASLTSVSPGTYQFTGPGGADVGAFTASLKVPVNLTWTNQSSVTGSPVNRASSLTVTWSGGDPTAYAVIQGTSINPINNSFSIGASFVCVAPISANSFTIPASVLLSLPATNSAQFSLGNLMVGSTSTPQTFTAPGLDAGYAVSESFTLSSVTWQ